MMQPHLQRRFDTLLETATDPAFSMIAREQIAAARELNDTLLACNLLTPEEWKAYHSQVMSAQLIVSSAELQRITDAARI